MSPWCTKIAITRSILKLQDSSFAHKPDFGSLVVGGFLKFPPFLGGQRRKEVGGKEAALITIKFFVFDI